MRSLALAAILGLSVSTAQAAVIDLGTLDTGRRDLFTYEIRSGGGPVFIDDTCLFALERPLTVTLLNDFRIFSIIPLSINETDGSLLVSCPLSNPTVCGPVSVPAGG